MRPTWTGAVSFGLLDIPVSLMSGERRIDPHFRMPDSGDYEKPGVRLGDILRAPGTVGIARGVESGTGETAGDPAAAMAAGKPDFTLHGRHLGGQWRLVRPVAPASARSGS